MFIKKSLWAAALVAQTCTAGTAKPRDDAKCTKTTVAIL